MIETKEIAYWSSRVIALLKLMGLLHFKVTDQSDDFYAESYSMKTVEI